MYSYKYYEYFMIKINILIFVKFYLKIIYYLYIVMHIVNIYLNIVCVVYIVFLIMIKKKYLSNISLYD